MTTNQLPVETIGPADAPLCLVWHGSTLPAGTVFPTPLEFPLQSGYVVHPANHAVQRHFHRPLSHQTTGYSEVILVLRGRCELTVYDDDRMLVATRLLEQGSVMVMVRGGHGFRMLEDTVLFEVKKGPFGGPAEKVHF
jgi:hypothetical protein